MANRPCTVCLISKEVSPEFYRPGKGYADGFHRQCKVCEVAASTARVWALRLALIEQMGDCCQGCGIADPRVLCFDHIHGGGRRDRDRHLSPTAYLKLVRSRTADFQLLCHNCNFLKRMENGEHGQYAQLLSN